MGGRLASIPLLLGILIDPNVDLELARQHDEIAQKRVETSDDLTSNRCLIGSSASASSEP